jgi:ANTAR domain
LSATAWPPGTACTARPKSYSYRCWWLVSSPAVGVVLRRGLIAVSLVSGRCPYGFGRSWGSNAARPIRWIIGDSPQTRAVTDQLRITLESRSVIDQAKGILMGTRRIPADHAFILLVEQSQRENVKLRSLAERFVASIIGNDQSPTDAP